MPCRQSHFLRRADNGKIKKIGEVNKVCDKYVKYAEKASNDIKKNAIEESKLIVMDAKRNASHIVNDALLRADKIEARADMLERNIVTFKRKLKLIIDQQQSVIEDIDELELEKEDK